ncbi:stage III sporulation protein AF [Cytobacillus purgationiresistens]|uniref:Stage III sporulation protein AF n=1 Tax=Cytobacillus purgationiresistens TaxID=863449 RepID=A0ABU0ADS5_9BACI|nr:stage III sporulation protein AF [Cytobacillus purgationiresistens]MDQ0269398.1 stage III sporulation protein AF [Cytobacillus purgationiresistens]
MDFIKEWITNIILFVLLATVIDLLLPNSALQKYTKMVTGLLLIAIILTPIFKLVSTDFEAALSSASVPTLKASGEKNIENSIELQKKEIQASQHAYALEDITKSLELQAEEELMEQYGLEITKIKFIVDERAKAEFPDNLQKLLVEVRSIDEEKEAEVVEVVQRVEVNTGKPLTTNEVKDAPKEVASLLSKSWEIDEQNIEVFTEGGIAKKDG